MIYDVHILLTTVNEIFVMALLKLMHSHFQFVLFRFVSKEKLQWIKFLKRRIDIVSISGSLKNSNQSDTASNILCECVFVFQTHTIFYFTIIKLKHRESIIINVADSCWKLDFSLR